jgi:hypothetical protein
MTNLFAIDFVFVTAQYANWLYVYFPCSIVDCVVRKNAFMEICKIISNN